MTPQSSAHQTQSTETNAVELRQLNIRFDTDGGEVSAVNGISLTVQPGEITAIVGESGSGKTVTARSLLGLLPDNARTDGAVVVDGHEVTALSKAQLRALRGRNAAMVFQEPSTALNPVYPVGWQIAEGLRAHRRISRKEARAEAVEILRQVGIPEPEKRVGHYPHQFSGGQKQRVVIAMALVLRPSVIIADEPTTALDVTVQAEILDLLRRCRDKLGAAIVLITHNMGVVADLADTVAVMYRGDLVEQAPVEKIFAEPEHDYTRRLLGAVLRLGEGKERRRSTTQIAEAGAEGHGDDQATEPGPAVEAEDLRITYPGGLGRPDFTAVQGVSLTVPAGRVLGLVGESGSGKSTIGRAVAGLTPVAGGALRVLGRSVVGAKERQLKKLRRDLGFVFQDPASSFNPLLTIGQCLAEPLVVSGEAGSANAARPRVAELLDAVQLPAAFADRFPHELSGGQRQRASLARALALRPKLVIADEPTSALDVSVQAAVLELFQSLQREFGFAAIFITHDLAVVDLVSDQVAVLRSGQLVEHGPVDDVLSAPQDPYTQRLLASVPVPDPAEQRSRREALSSPGN
ncbi:ABC transporter ATP-binding protein [Nesterenkonia sp.]|uniref:dipeptide ABC transporter ATP-binding protein n=1 Tax=Nesterenkonia sp. TaxID=704201 RepID=UPI002634D53D|nr:ABC transporter ATP-binding protein [Nesterenkonia sp.]